jgi:hypothetical protein
MLDFDIPAEMPHDKQFEALDFGFFIPRMLQSDIDGQYARRQVANYLARAIASDKAPQDDNAASPEDPNVPRRIIIALLRDFDARSQANELSPAYTADVLDKLDTVFHALEPEEVAACFDASVSTLEREARGSQVEALKSAVEKFAEKLREKREAEYAAERAAEERRIKKGHDAAGLLEGVPPDLVVESDQFSEACDLTDARAERIVDRMFGKR